MGVIRKDANEWNRAEIQMDLVGLRVENDEIGQRGIQANRTVQTEFLLLPVEDDEFTERLVDIIDGQVGVVRLEMNIERERPLEFHDALSGESNRLTVIGNVDDHLRLIRS